MKGFVVWKLAFSWLPSLWNNLGKQSPVHFDKIVSKFKFQSYSKSQVFELTHCLLFQLYTSIRCLLVSLSYSVWYFICKIIFQYIILDSQHNHRFIGFKVAWHFVIKHKPCRPVERNIRLHGRYISDPSRLFFVILLLCLVYSFNINWFGLAIYITYNVNFCNRK